MDLASSDDQIAYRDKFRAWLDVHCPATWSSPRHERSEDEDQSVEQEKAWERMLYVAGYAGIAWPAVFGGQGLTAVEQLIVSSELGRRGAPEGVAMIGRDVVGPTLLAIGTDEQKRHFIPRLLRVDDIWCLGLSEPNAGSDLASLRTRAVRDGDAWVITGQKVWTSYAHHADMCLLLARTDLHAGGHRGLSLFLVDMKAAGIATRPIVQITGKREFNDVFFDDVWVPGNRLLGEENKGWEITADVLHLTRACTPMHRNGRQIWEFDLLLEVCQRPDRRGERPIDNAHYRQRLAEIFADLEIHRYHMLEMAGQAAKGVELGHAASIVKLVWSETHQRMTEFAIDVSGDAAAGIGDDAVCWQRAYLQARADTIFAGTSEIQRNIVAENILGLPR